MVFYRVVLRNLGSDSVPACLTCRDGAATLPAFALPAAATSSDSRALLLVEAVGGILPYKCSAAFLCIVHLAPRKDIMVRDHIYKSRRLYCESGPLSRLRQVDLL